MSKRSTIILPLVLFTIGNISYGTDGSGDSMAKTFEKILMQADSIVQSLSQEPQIRMKEVEPANTLFQEYIRQYPFFTSLMRANSKGILVNEVTADTVYRDQFRDVGNEEWYKNPLESQKPFFGPVIKKGGRAIAFWSVPVFIKKENGTFRVAGIAGACVDILSLIPVKKLPRTVSFQCLSDQSVFYRSSKQPVQNYGDYPVTMRDAAYFTLRIEKPVTPFVDNKESPDSISRNTHTSQALPSVPDKKAPGERVSETQRSLRAEPVSVGRTGSVRTLVWIVPALVFIVLIGVLVFILKKKRKEDRGEEVPAAGPMDVVRDEGPVLVDEARKKRIEEEEGERIRKVVMDELRDGIRKEILAADTAKMSDEIRQEIRTKLEDDITRDQSKEIRDAVEEKLKEFFVNELKEIVYKKVRKESFETLEKEARESIRNEILERLLKAEVEKIEQEAAEKLRENVYARIRLEKEPELEQRIRSQIEQDIYRKIQETQIQEITEQIRNQFQEKIRKEFEEKELQAFEQEARNGLKQELLHRIRETEYDALYGLARKELEQTIHDTVMTHDSEAIHAQERQKIEEQVRKELMEKQWENILIQERELIRKDAIAIVRNNEYVDILNSQRDVIRADIRARITNQEYASIEVSELDTVKEEIRNKIRTEELDAITRQMREELAALIQKELELNCRESTYNSLREKLVAEIQEYLMKEEREKIRNTIYDQIVNEERNKINALERDSIIQAERSRICRDEYERLREEVKRDIYEKEYKNIFEKTKKEIYEETFEDMKRDVQRKTASSLTLSFNKEKERIEQGVKEEILTLFKNKWKAVVTELDALEQVLKNGKAVESLRNTVEKMGEEKKRYKFFNLNAAQTESLIEYLQRLQNNLEKTMSGIESYFHALKAKITTLSWGSADSPFPAQNDGDDQKDRKPEPGN